MKILITGASSGLGEELARKYASSENSLILLARREDRLKSLQKELESLCKSVKILVADVTEFEVLQTKIASIGSVDMVILNAGVSVGHSKEVIAFSDFKKIYDVNVLANHAILEILLPKFEEQKSGKIVFISSLASLISLPSSQAYSSSKSAISAYAEALRYKYSSTNIKVINILPGFIKSEMTDKNKFKMPFLLETKDGVSRIVHAIQTNKRVYAFPLRFYLIIRALNVLPKFIREKTISLLK
ncbi:MAG: SDR family NAD(P)-dependent oxidoreductase [Sulfurimonas sp.]|nr:SDR family NAD(P)-dependent oxidoreductase [Sulfurimonas sp.]MDQ7060292.1 SDR family NAD(P)-dependent oxidoreductase [Sulfurimonas sp.]